MTEQYIEALEWARSLIADCTEHNRDLVMSLLGECDADEDKWKIQRAKNIVEQTSGMQEIDEFLRRKIKYGSCHE